MAACGPDDQEPDVDPQPIEDPAEDPDDGLADSTDPDPDGPGDDETRDEEATEPDADGNGNGNDEASDTEPLDVEETTARTERDSDAARLGIIDVRVGAHEGFDRVTFELQGEGQVGWFTELTEEPTSQGSGLPVEFEGQIALWLSAQGIVLPGDEPENLDEDSRIDVDIVVDGPDGGIVTQVVGDTIFEGIQTFAIGLEEERPYRIERFEDPERIVIDVLHD